MKFSLVVCTLGRQMEPDRLLTSLRSQSYRHFEVIVVDQNDDTTLLTETLARHADALDIRHLRSAKGLSLGRNVALAAAGGDVVAFPDDDCWYDAGVLEHVERWFAQHPELALLAGCSVDEHGHQSNGRFDADAGPITKANVWARGISYTLFVRRAAIAAARLRFDEQLGAGSSSRWKSGEETDFVLRLLSAAHRAWYDPSLIVRHPKTTIKSGSALRERSIDYAAGYVRVLTQHGYPRSQLALSIVRPIAGAGLALLRADGKQARAGLWTAYGRALEALRTWRE